MSSYEWEKRPRVEAGLDCTALVSRKNCDCEFDRSSCEPSLRGRFDDCAIVISSSARRLKLGGRLGVLLVCKSRGRSRSVLELVTLAGGRCDAGVMGGGMLGDGTALKAMFSGLLALGKAYFGKRKSV